jgi:hypothetical protein
MKTLTKTAIVLAFFMAATMAQADDAAMKKELLGYWASGRHAYLFKDDGISYMLGGTSKSKWDIRNGMYYESNVDGTNALKPAKIISLTKSKFTTQDTSGIHTLKRLTQEGAEKTYGKPGELP